MSEELNIVRPGDGTVIMSEKEYEQLVARPRSPFSKGKGFTQLNLEHCEDLSALTSINATATRILLFLFEKADKYNKIICSYDVFCIALGVSKATVQRAIKVLKDSQYLKIYKTGSSNVYCLNSDVVWKNWGDKYSHAEFVAKVIIDASEQDWDSTKISYHHNKTIYKDEEKAKQKEEEKRKWLEIAKQKEENRLRNKMTFTSEELEQMSIDDFDDEEVDPEDLPMEDVI